MLPYEMLHPLLHRPASHILTAGACVTLAVPADYTELHHPQAFRYVLRCPRLGFVASICITSLTREFIYLIHMLPNLDHLY